MCSQCLYARCIIKYETLDVSGIFNPECITEPIMSDERILKEKQQHAISSILGWTLLICKSPVNFSLCCALALLWVVLYWNLQNILHRFISSGETWKKKNKNKNVLLRFLQEKQTEQKNHSPKWSKWKKHRESKQAPTVAQQTCYSWKLFPFLMWFLSSFLLNRNTKTTRAEQPKFNIVPSHTNLNNNTIFYKKKKCKNTNKP